MSVKKKRTIGPCRGVTWLYYVVLLWSRDFFPPLYLDPRFRPLLLKYITYTCHARMYVSLSLSLSLLCSDTARMRHSQLIVLADFREFEVVACHCLEMITISGAFMVRQLRFCESSELSKTAAMLCRVSALFGANQALTSRPERRFGSGRNERERYGPNSISPGKKNQN